MPFTRRVGPRTCHCLIVYCQKNVLQTFYQTPSAAERGGDRLELPKQTMSFSLQHEKLRLIRKERQNFKDHQRLSYWAFEILCVLLPIPPLAPRWTWSVDTHSDILSCFLESGIEKKNERLFFFPELMPSRFASVS